MADAGGAGGTTGGAGGTTGGAGGTTGGAGGTTGGAGGATGGAGGIGGGGEGGVGGGSVDAGPQPSAEHCMPEGAIDDWSARRNCTTPQVEALTAAGLGGRKAFQFGAYSHELDVPMTAGSAYAFSIGMGSLDSADLGVELWGTTEECGGEIERLDAQNIGAATDFRGVICATLQPSQSFKYLLLVVRSNGGFSHSLQTACPTGECRSSDGVPGDWAGLDQPFCDPSEPQDCEACIDTTSCDAPIYTEAGEGITMSSCCGLEWARMQSEPMTYADAMSYCSSLMLGGSGWRVPTLAELLTLVDPSLSPTIDPIAFPDANAATLWSSTAYRYQRDELAVVHFGNGLVDDVEADRTNPVRCVR